MTDNDPGAIADWLRELLTECEQTARRQAQMRSWAPGDKAVDQKPRPITGADPITRKR